MLILLVVPWSHVEYEETVEAVGLISERWGKLVQTLRQELKWALAMQTELKGSKCHHDG